MKTLFKKLIKKYIRKVCFNDIMVFPDADVSVSVQKGRDYMDWIYSDLVELVEKFVKENAILDSRFIKGMNAVFKTDRFEALVKKFSGEYLLGLFKIIDDYARHDKGMKKRLVLEDNPINRFAVKKYSEKFKATPNVRWVRSGYVLSRILVVFSQALFILYLSLNRGVSLFVKKNRYKVMRESIWGLNSTMGRYFHDDFLVDGKMIKEEDLLLFSRKDMMACDMRKKAYEDSRVSPYKNIYLPSLTIGFKSFFVRVVPLYIVSGIRVLLAEIGSVNFSLFSSLFRYFVNSAMHYEKIFSSYEIGAELGHDYSLTRHIAESIVCHSVGTRYCLMHWSDLSLDAAKYVVSFLGCDKYLVWGAAHVRGYEGVPIVRSGYIFKSVIKNAKSCREDILKDMGITSAGKVVTFFDETFSSESFGGGFIYTPGHYVNFWKTALELAMKEPRATVIMKPKELSRYHGLPRELKDSFLEIKKRMEGLDNVHIIDTSKWSFIECIGVSDIVITQGMSSSATIAIVCGIEGLYLNESGLDNAFLTMLKDKVVFDKSDRLLMMVRDILAGKISALEMIPEELVRKYDEFPDERGIDMLRSVLTGSGTGVAHN